MPFNLGIAQLALIFFIMVLLAIPWVVGVGKLFEKGHSKLGRVALVGFVVPIIFPLGYAGWFVPRRSRSA
ncbi:MAG: hypothetical protein ACC683_11690 [Acidimicrobiia bacterium]